MDGSQGRGIATEKIERKSGNGSSSFRSRASDLALLVLVALVIVLMVVPMGQWVLDLLIGANLALSLTIFATALFMRRPIDFSAFPTVLLIATLYRLALNIASTRLILTEADAGKIIGAFGGFVVGSDLLVGAVIFGILALVLFLVITKGAERVAEVSARFTLDALPGLQLAIETDLRAGAISPRELSRRREDLESRSHYYGSLDGAMKFVRGDAIAALVIIVVNILGGMAVGTLRHDLSLLEALDTYGRLTVGDGLVTMIPALLISTAAGLLVTRVGQGASGDRLGLQISRQLASEPRALVAAGSVMLMLAVVPLLPAWPFLVMGGLLAIGGLAAFVSRRREGTGENAEDSVKRRATGATSYGLDETQALLDELSARSPVLVRETIPSKVSLPLLADLLSIMEGDGLGPDLLPHLLEALAREESCSDPEELMERARKRMAGVITDLVVGDASRSVEVTVLDGELESVLVASLARTSTGLKISAPGDLLEELKEAFEKAVASRPSPVILVAPRLRLPLRKMLRAWDIEAVVVAHGELLPGLDIASTNTISA